MLRPDHTSRLVVEDGETGLVGIYLSHEHRVTWFDPETRLPVQYRLNEKLFQINEPYFMKSERDSLLQCKLAVEGDTDLAESNSKRCRKRKRAMSKKVAYLEANLTPAERSTARKLVEGVCGTGSALGQPVDAQVVLGQLDPCEREANRSAQAFVSSLFCNRFESLNYRGKVLCNPYKRAGRVKFGLSHYLIPGRCSFAGVDVIEGVGSLAEWLRVSSRQSPCPLSAHSPFLVVMDPAWDNNKSVKRKKSYETVSLDYLRRMCGHVRSLLDLVVALKARHDHCSPPLLVAIWTTKADRDFVISEMFPSLALDLAYDLKWHKVTKAGLPVKVHGGAEYLVIGSRSDVSAAAKPRCGLVLSVPSAVHSHKPPLLALFEALFGTRLPYCRPGHHQPSLPSHPEDLAGEHSLVQNEVILPLCGLELFSRYLHTGFHSIGFECIKLQNERLFEAS